VQHRPEGQLTLDGLCATAGERNPPELLDLLRVQSSYIDMVAVVVTVRAESGVPRSVDILSNAVHKRTEVVEGTVRCLAGFGHGCLRSGTAGFFTKNSLDVRESQALLKFKTPANVKIETLSELCASGTFTETSVVGGC